MGKPDLSALFDNPQDVVQGGTAAPRPAMADLSNLFYKSSDQAGQEVRSGEYRYAFAPEEIGRAHV